MKVFRIVIRSHSIYYFIVTFDTYQVVFCLLLHTVEIIPIILTGGKRKPFLDPQLCKT